MDDHEYELQDEDPRVNRCSRLFSCLYAYTIGSCLYFRTENEADQNSSAVWRSNESNTEEIELKPAEIPNSQQSGTSNLEKESDTYMYNEWRKAECRMKKRIQYHFTDHIRRWMDMDRRRFPWKMMLHLLLVVLVTTQISLYAVDRSKLTNFLIETDEAVEQYFSPENKAAALYKLDDVYDRIESIVERYYSLPEQFVALSSICYVNDTDILEMSIEYLEVQECPECNQKYKKTYPNTTNSLTISRQLFLPTTTSNDSDLLSNKTTCDDENMCCTSDQCNYSIRDQVRHFINLRNLYRIKQVEFQFTLYRTYQKGVIEDYNAVNVSFFVDILLSGHDYLHSSHINVQINLESKLTRSCRETVRPQTTVIDIIVVAVSLLASLGYLLSVIRSAQLAKDVKLHFLVYHEKKLRWNETHVLFNKFYILMLFTCCLLIVTTIIKIASEYRETISLRLIEDVGIMLAIGIFLLCFGLFGFLRYFESLNVLLITLKLAIPSVLRFAVCMMILFTAFTFCGWLIMGPYNPEFSNPLTAAETLVGILNGDGMADAFSATSSRSVTNSTQLSIVGKIYLIFFVFIFIYIVLSLFIGIFDHAYDSLSAHWRDRSRGFLWDWAEREQDDDPTRNYPFPVPRIRDFSHEFRAPRYKIHSCSTQSTKKKKSRKGFAATSGMINNPPLLPNFNSNDSDNTSSDENTGLRHYFSDSALKRQSGHMKQPRYRNTCYIIRSQRRHYGSSRFRSLKSNTSFAKSVVEQPPDASQQEVAKAKLKLLHKGHNLEMSMLQEDM